MADGNIGRNPDKAQVFFVISNIFNIFAKDCLTSYI